MPGREKADETEGNREMIYVNKEKISKSFMDEYVHRWEKRKTDLLAFYAMREETVGEDLLEGLAHYYDFLAQCHGLVSLDIDSLSQLEALPLNGVERLHFIEKSPKQYAAFLQLDELIQETIKKLARLRVQQ